MAMNDFFKNLKFEFEGGQIIIKDEKDFLNYINTINGKEIDFEKSCHKNENNLEKNDIKNKEKLEEINFRTFIPLFDLNNYCFYETISNNIIFTTEPQNEININKAFNNVFILNKNLEKESELCFEIKLGNGLWNNLFSSLTKKNNIKNANFGMNSFKIGLLKLNADNIKHISEYLSISSSKEINKKIIFGFDRNCNLNQEKYDLLSSKYDNFQKNIFYYFDFIHLIFTIKKNNIQINRLIQNNDVIGVVINNKNQDFIEIKIYVNGEFINCQLICKEIDNDSNNLSDVDDEYIIEEKKNSKESILVPFIEIGANKSLFIKDKPNTNHDKHIITHEKMEYYNIYNCLPLNNFTDNIYEIQIITNYYLDILKKVGSTILNQFPNKIEKYFNQLIIFFNKYVFNNEIIIKNQIISFLSSGINLNGDIEHFKGNLKILFVIIDKFDRIIDEKIKIVKLIVNLLIELIIEINFNLINDDELNSDNNKVKIQISNLRKYKFILLFLLFDNYIKEENIIKELFHQYIFFNESSFIIFCYAIFNSCFYKNSANKLDYLKSFYDQQNKFEKKKFLEFSFNKYNEENENDIYNIFFQDYGFFIQYIKDNIILKIGNETNLFFKFIINFLKTEDNPSIINGIILQLIKNYFDNISINLNKDQLDKLLITCYINEKTKNLIPYKSQNYNSSEIQKKHSNLFNNNNFNDKEIKNFLIFDLIVNSISNFYELFLIKYKNAISSVEYLENNKNSINSIQNYEINKFNYMIEFYQLIFSRKIYIRIISYAIYLLEIIELCDKNDYLDLLPYKTYSKNILFILDFLQIRLSFIDTKNILDKNEPKMISSISQKALKYVMIFLRKYFDKILHRKYSLENYFEEVICLNIQILKNVLMFDVGAIKQSLKDAKENFPLIFKNLLELYDKQKFKIAYYNINLFIDFLYNYEYNEHNKEHIDKEVKNLFFKTKMKEEIEEFKKMKNEEEQKKNNFIENTLYFNIFMFIYKRLKTVINSLKELFGKIDLFNKDDFLEKKYIIKITKLIKILYNFLRENKLYFFYDVDCVSFLKINSFICKIFKILYTEKNIKKLQVIYEKNNKIIVDFFTQFFFLLSLLLVNKENPFDYNYKFAKNRNGFYFNEFKLNFEKYFGYSDFRTMIELLDILLNSFRKFCPDNETLKTDEVDDNSIEIDKRDVCPICLELIDEKDVVHLSECNHKYHLECLKKQIANNLKRCSLCKRNITGIKEDPNFKVDIDSTNIQNDHSNIFSLNINNNPFLSRNSVNIFGDHSQSNETRSLFSTNNLFEQNQNRNLFTNNRNGGQNLFGASNNIFNNGGLFSNSNNNQNNLFGNNGLFGQSNNSLFG